MDLCASVLDGRLDTASQLLYSSRHILQLQGWKELRRGLIHVFERFSKISDYKMYESLNNLYLRGFKVQRYESN